ncbi:LacI family DNA-binding transcriptional regulator [Amycolatopsis orientalis]|uniref:LacI family transcriptional regulator n=1 Tax=Amycolatopsis orientalis TaxID=31958 RepID=A0A193C1H6_AMYOR|nr:LacI family DNA-binding transcriptional regulator [Amycolatopsis orientalis]ANN18253.1 LacI family transcriptional regulator [Amycolatopsis orientalis]
MSAVELPDIRPTLADVARVAGVSTATASRVLNGFAKVRPETRDQVKSAMIALGYARRRAASLKDVRRTGSIALVVCEKMLQVFADPYVARIAAGMTKELATAGAQLVLIPMSSTEDYPASIVHYLADGHVDGALVIGMHGRYPLDLAWLGIPVVFGGRPVCDEDSGQYSYVDADNRGGAEQAVRHLLASGRRTIATIAGPQDMVAGIDRLLGYRKAICKADGIDDSLVVFGDFGLASGDHATARLLERRPDVDAIFAASDLMAAGALRALRRAGRRVPEDVAVIGFDDLPVGRRTEPPLTTVRQPIEEMGARMARELLAMINGPATPPSLVFDTELIVRESA